MQKITLLQVQMRLMGKRRQGLTLKHRLVELLLSFFRIRGGLFTHMIWRSSTVNK